MYCMKAHINLKMYLKLLSKKIKFLFRWKNNNHIILKVLIKLIVLIPPNHSDLVILEEPLLFMNNKDQILIYKLKAYDQNINYFHKFFLIIF